MSTHYIPQPAPTVDLGQDPLKSAALRKLGILGIVFLICGAGAWFAQLTMGLLETSGMSNIFVWGLMIAVFAFLVGFGAGSQLVSTAIALSGREDLKPYGLIAAVVGFSCVLAAAIAVLVDLGAIRNIFAMLLGPNLRSPLTWDMVALTLFLVLSIVQLIAISVGHKLVKALSVLAGLAAILLQVVEGLLFSLQSAHAWWATPIMPVDFLMVAFASGGLIMLLIAALHGAQTKALGWLAKFAAVAILLHLILAIVDLIMVSVEGTPQSAAVMAALGDNLGLYLMELLLPAIAMVVLFVFGQRGKRGICAIAAIVGIVGIFAHRLMLIYPAYGAPSLFLNLSGTDVVTGAYPISTGRYLAGENVFSTVSSYAPDGMEWMASMLPIGLAIVVAIVVLFLMHLINVRVASRAKEEAAEA